MDFKLNQALEVLERTPTTLSHLLSGLSDKWIYQNEGGESWSPFHKIGHFIDSEKTDWILRAKHI
ncbi:MAG: hypothetical protein HRT68_16150 [Flavobacteriaceae bacterium]|nr:hypothetical protein [Flavobacteriaceae bacterium]